MFFFCRYNGKIDLWPYPYDLEYCLVDILRQIWNFNTQSDKLNYIDCIVREKWCIDFAGKKWEENFIDFEVAIERIRRTDSTFIDFNRIGILECETKVLDLLRKKCFFFRKWEQLIWDIF